jgi:cyanate permease
MNFPYTAKPVRRLTPTGAMMIITATVGASSVLLFLVCVIYSQDPWPAALASFSLAGMATGFGYFISQRRPL